MSADGNTVREALMRLRGDHLPNYADEDSFELATSALAALARLEAASTDWLALAGRCERAEAQRDALADGITEMVDVARHRYPHSQIIGIGDKALAEAGLE